MDEIKIKDIGNDKFAVDVIEGTSVSQHTVRLTEDVWMELTDGALSKEELIRKSFEFLLEQEPKESILSSFDLLKIEEYFPEYRDEIQD